MRPSWSWDVEPKGRKICPKVHAVNCSSTVTTPGTVAANSTAIRCCSASAFPPTVAIPSLTLTVHGTKSAEYSASRAQIPCSITLSSGVNVSTHQIC